MGTVNSPVAAWQLTIIRSVTWMKQRAALAAELEAALAASVAELESRNAEHMGERQRLVDEHADALAACASTPFGWAMAALLAALIAAAEVMLSARKQQLNGERQEAREAQTNSFDASRKMEEENEKLRLYGAQKNDLENQVKCIEEEKCIARAPANQV